MADRITATTVCADLRAFAEFLEEQPPDLRAYAADELNKQLDDWRSQDGFGTEGQMDPRGDRRE